LRLYISLCLPMYFHCVRWQSANLPCLSYYQSPLYRWLK